MPLKLTITSYQRLSPGQETTKLLNDGAISIGRSAQNDWILQDPERILSGKHCTIHHQGGSYFLTDTSTNGVFLNNSQERIDRNQVVKLKDGDHFILGEYEIAVTLTPSAAALMEPEPEEPEAEGPLTDIMPPPLLGPDIAAIEGPRPGSMVDAAKPSFADIMSEVSLGQPRTPGAPAHGVVTEPPSDLLAPDRAFFEPPALVSETPTPEPPPPPAAETDFATPSPAAETDFAIPPLPEPFAPPAPPPEPFATPVPPLPEPFAPPAPPPDRAEPPLPITAAPVQEPLPEESLIPEDWWLAPPAAPQPTAIPPLEATAPPHPVAPLAVLESSAEPRPSHPLAPPAPVVPTAPPPAPVVPTAPPPTPVVPAAPSGSSAEDLLRIFLERAGLAHTTLTADQLPEILANLGTIFRETVQGLMDILQARSDVKSEFRLDRTTIGPVENNPLKTPPGQTPLSPEMVMALLLIRRKDAYMSPQQAVHEGFQDIKAHQYAVWEGVRAAMAHLLERFDPHNLETRLQQTVLDSILPVNRKAKYWDLFTSEYQAIVHEAEEDFNELFGNEFVRAYEQHLSEQ